MGIYQRMIAAYREPHRARGRELMTALIKSLSHGVPGALTELITLGRTLQKRAYEPTRGHHLAVDWLSSEGLVDPDAATDFIRAHPTPSVP